MKRYICISLFMIFLFVLVSNAGAINITSCGNISISGKYDLVNDISSRGSCLNIVNVMNVELDCNGKSIKFNSSNTTPLFEYSGIQIIDVGSPVRNISVRNCNITGFGDRLTGIRIEAAELVKVDNNQIYISDLSLLKGISVLYSRNVNITNNSISLNSVRPRTNGIILQSTDFVTVEDNSIYVDGNVGNNMGIVLSPAAWANQRTRILNNTIKTGSSKSPANHGIYSASTINLSSSRNKLYVSGVNTSAIYLYSTSGSFKFEELYDSPQWIFNYLSRTTNFTEISFITDKGSIKISNFFLSNPRSMLYNIDRYILNISQNKANILTIQLPELNKSSTVTLLNTGIMNPMIEADYSDSGTYVYCSPPSCKIMSSLNGNINFSVDHFTAYRAVQLACALCGDVNIDGAVSIMDALTDARIANGLIIPTPLQAICGDVNSDGAINVLDALLIARNTSGLPVALMCL